MDATILNSQLPPVPSELAAHDQNFAKLAFISAHARAPSHEELNNFFAIIAINGREGLLGHLQAERTGNTTSITEPKKEQELIAKPIWEQLLEYGFNRRNIWFGRLCPFKADIFDFGKYSNFRAESKLHGSYDVIWLYERSIFDFPGWKLLLDEAIRLLTHNGKLIIRSVDAGNGTLWELKSILGRMVTVNCELTSQSKLKDGSVVSIFSISRKFFDAYQDKSWTIGILSNGQKESNVLDLMEKIMHLRKDHDVEFIISGPKLKGHAPAPVRYVEIDSTDNLPRISEKKKALMDSASHTNVALFHDRYVVNDDFFLGFEKFGYDFDFISIAQNYEGGEVFPGYAGMKDRIMRWQPPLFDEDYNTLFEGHFVNGGLMIFKRHLRDFVKFNPLLLHNEAEDVEISFILKDHGIAPRINKYSSATTVGVLPHYTGTFKNIKNMDAQ